MKYAHMRSDAFVFLRGTCHLFYARLQRKGVFKSAPSVWACGDLHLENFGSFKGDNRLPYFDMNDFDEAALAPASWDLIRMLVSLRLAAASLGLSAETTLTICESYLQGYRLALQEGKAYWVEAQTATGLIGHLLQSLHERKRVDFLNARTTVKGHRRRFHVDGKRALEASARQQERVRSFMEEFAHAQAEPGFFRVLDVVRRIAGTGSLGVDRYAILVHGRGGPGGQFILDLKEALPSSMVEHLPLKQPDWPTQAHRVVAIQRRVQAVSMAFLQPVRLGKKSYILRGLQPVEDRVSLAAAKQNSHDMQRFTATLGRITAWGELRSSGREGAATADELMAFAHRRKWPERMLQASHEMANQVIADSLEFARAYDDGVFGS